MNKSKLPLNVLIVLAGVVLLIIGFICLGQGPADNPISLSLAPVLLVIAYVIIIPIGIMASGSSVTEENKGD
jgi:hypothetical protein